MEKIIARPGAWAFWRYDQFPYLLGGQIGEHKNRKEWCNGESVFIPSYGHFFKPSFCVDEEEGPVLMNSIKHLESENAKALKDLREKMNAERHRSAVGQLDPR